MQQCAVIESRYAHVPEQTVNAVVDMSWLVVLLLFNAGALAPQSACGYSDASSKGFCSPDLCISNNFIMKGYNVYSGCWASVAWLLVDYQRLSLQIVLQKPRSGQCPSGMPYLGACTDCRVS